MDLQAGLNVALLAIPQGMAYALIAGLPLYYGLLGSGIAALAGGIFGSGKFITLGPTNATAVLLFGIFASLGMTVEGRNLDTSALSVIPGILICTGFILCVAGFLKVSYIVKFISRTVITGYITAAALLIIINQVPSILGIQSEYISGTTFFELVTDISEHLKESSFPEIFLGGITALIFLILQKKYPLFPNVALSLISCSFLSNYLPFFGEKISYLQDFDTLIIPLSFPNITNSLEMWEVILQASFALSLLCLIEGLSIGKSLASRQGSRIDENKETISFGIGNLACAIFSGMPASGSLTRSSLNVNSGAVGKVSNIFTGIFVLVGYFFMGKFVAFIPVCSLAMLVIFIGLSLLKWSHLTTAIRTSKSDAATFLVTFSIGIIFSLQMAIFLGVITSLILFLKKVAEPEMVEHGYNENGELAQISTKNDTKATEVSIVHVEGELFFAAADLFYEQMRRVGEKGNIKVLILKLLNARHLDATSVLAFSELLNYLNECGCSVILCEVKEDTLKILKNSGFLKIMNKKNVFPHDASNPTLSTAKAVKRAKELTQTEKVDVTIYSEEKKIYS